MDLMAAKKKADDERKQINISLATDDYKRVEKYASLLPITAIARALMLIGLEQVEKRGPQILLETPAKRR